MSDVTDADRERARRLAENLIDEASMAAEYPASYGEAGRDVATEAIAAALAEERRKARAPFLAVADAIESSAGVKARWSPWSTGHAAGRAYVAHRIRVAAKENGE